MPNLDLAKVALIVVLVAALVGLGAWFITDVMPDIVASGVSATTGLSSSGAAAAWGAVVSMFGPWWRTSWGLALSIVGLLAGAMLVFRVIKWVA